jgi:hypothetical protein
MRSEIAHFVGRMMRYITNEIASRFGELHRPISSPVKVQVLVD